MLLCGAEREEDPLTMKRTTTGKCTGTDVGKTSTPTTSPYMPRGDTPSFIYADDLCIASQGNDFNIDQVISGKALP